MRFSEQCISMLIAIKSCFAFAGGNTIINTGKSIDEVYQKNLILGACEKYIKDSTNEQLELLCGKDIFFHLNIKTDIGIPEQLLNQFKDGFSEEVGTNFEKLGFQMTSDAQPLGLVDIKPLKKLQPKDLLTFGNLKQIACAACHVGKLPDGRFSVGMPNENLDIARFNLLSVYPLWLATQETKKKVAWIPELNEYYTETTRRLKNQKKFGAVLKVSELVGQLKLDRLYFNFLTQDPPSLGDQRTYLKGEPGIYNAASPMLSFGDRELMSTPPAIWEVDGATESGIKEAYFGTITSADSFDGFLKHAFAYSSLTDQFSKDETLIKPLKAYLKSLRLPKTPEKLNLSLVENGAQTFETMCVSCHDGPLGASSKRHPVAAVGSPLAYDHIFSDFTGSTRQSRQLIKSLQGAYPFEKDVYGLKARRLGGIWTRKFLMTNGSVKGVDHLFCLEETHGSLMDRPEGSPHRDLCELELSDKLALREYLKSL